MLTKTQKIDYGEQLGSGMHVNFADVIRIK